MARTQSLFANSQGWLHDLARLEVFPEAEKLMSGASLDPHQMVEESTIQFLTDLRATFEDSAKTFNSYSEGGSKFSEVKIYSVAQSAADFMIFRNQIKLVVQNSGHGVVQLGFAQHSSPYQPGANGGGFPGAQELLAQVGPFRDIYWTFQSEKVLADQVARFYFTEFVKVTRENRKGQNSKAGNQQLLDQIKALLHEKGLDI